MGELVKANMSAKLVVASACTVFRERCRAAFASDAFPDLTMIEARAVRQLLLAIAPLRQAVLLIDQRMVQTGLGDLIDMLHGGGFSGPIVAAAPRDNLVSMPGCVAARLGCDAGIGELRQTLAGYLGASQRMAQPVLADEEPNLLVPLWIQERSIIERAIRACGGNVGRAARALEISPSTIYRKMQGWQAH